MRCAAAAAGVEPERHGAEQPGGYVALTRVREEPPPGSLRTHIVKLERASTLVNR